MTGIGNINEKPYWDVLPHELSRFHFEATAIECYDRDHRSAKETLGDETRETIQKELAPNICFISK